MKHMLKILILLFVGTSIYADIGNKKVWIVGNVKSDTPKYITPKYIEKNFKSINVTLYNPWEKRKDTYGGILLNQYISNFANADTKQVVIKAIDDYVVTFDKALWSKEKILLVHKVNNNFISIRDKGPMRIVFLNYDETNEEHKINLSKWMWMIKTIEFK